MIKKIIKFFLYFIFILTLLAIYLNIFGIKTNKLNNRINNEILKINKKINVELNTVKIILDIKNLAFKVKTIRPTIILDNQKLLLEEVNSNISIRAFIKQKFLINNLNISTKEINLSSLVLLAKSFKNTTELFLLDKIVKNGNVALDINLSFDDRGKLRDNYEINGYIKGGKLSIFKKYNIDNLDLLFKIKKNEYFLEELKVNFNKIKLSLPFIEIKELENIFSISGKILNKEKDISIELLSNLVKKTLKDSNIQKISFSSESNFRFDVNKKFQINNLMLKSKINLNNLVYKNKLLNFKKYLPNFKETFILKDHKILVAYKKNILDLSGEGDISIENNVDYLNYKFSKNKNIFNFNTLINIDKNHFFLDVLDYKKDKDLESQLNIKGSYKKNKETKFDLITLTEKKKNILTIKGLNLNNKLKITNINSASVNFINKYKIKNQINLKKNKKKYEIYGKSFDLSSLIDKIMNSDNDETSSIFENSNHMFNININKTYLDKSTYVNNLIGNINFVDNKIYKLNLDSVFPNKKKLVLSININKNDEKITTLFTDYPKPLVKKFKFIKGFEEGVLDFYSIKKNNISNSVLKIDNFKLKEVPILAKILTLASLKGIADILTGEGIRFTDFEMKFLTKKGLVNIDEIYAIGPAISILIDGYLEPKKLISLSGTLVPATTINRNIASIPLLGKILVGKKTGEGVFGVSFKIKGSPGNVRTTVNPIKTLTPRFITRTLEKIKKN